MIRELRFAPEALSDLDGIFLSIAADNPRRAESYIEEIVQKCQTLSTTPHIGVDRSSLRPGLRILPLWRRVIVVYDVLPDQVDILRVFWGRRDYEALLRDG